MFSIPSWAWPFASKTEREEQEEAMDCFSIFDLDDVTFFHYGGLEGLPSFDPECLKIHVHLREFEVLALHSLLDATENVSDKIYRGSDKGTAYVAHWPAPVHHDQDGEMLCWPST